MPIDSNILNLVDEDAPQGPTAQPDLVLGPNGRIIQPPPVTAATNAEIPATLDNGGGDLGTDADTLPLSITQAEHYAGAGSRQIFDDGSEITTQVFDDGSVLYTTKTAPIIQEGEGAVGDDGVTYTYSTAIEAPTDTAFESGYPSLDDQAQSFGLGSGVSQTSAPTGANYTSQTVQPQPNVLDRYYSYTYTASVYLMTPQQYEQLLRSKTKTISGYQLLFQSGGAANNVGGARSSGAPGVGDSAFATPSTGNAKDAGRNPFFTNDFYIDSIFLETVLPGKQTRAAHMATTLKFTVVEPLGITLLDRLYDAVKNFAPQDASGKVNYAAAQYLMVLKFYGYDEAGNIVQVSGVNKGGNSDPQSVVEKFIPFIIKKINWSVSSRLVTYEWECAPVGQLIAGTTARGSIPYDIQLTDSKVGGLLAGDAKYSSAAAPAQSPGASTTASTDAEAQEGGFYGEPPRKADAAPAKNQTITQGLMGAMNEFQADLVNRKIYTIPDEYSIEFVGADGIPAEAISGASIIIPQPKTDKKQTPSGRAPVENPQNLDPTKQSVDMIRRNVAITAGTQVLQAIEMAIRNSTYVTSQALTIQQPDGTELPNPNAKNKPMTWFTINMSATPKGPNIDPKRNDFAYKIKYTVTPYLVPNFDSKYFPVSRFRGIHKSYPIWFTGENTAVLDYTATFNNMYQITVNGNTEQDSANARLRERYTSSMREIPTYNYQAASTESRAGNEGKVGEMGANAAEYLYSPSDLHTAKVKIVGDPAWIQQGNLYRPVDSSNFNLAGFAPDGTINFESQQVLFEIAWQRPEDYDIETGLADPYGRTQKITGDRKPVQSHVYQCTKVLSEFRQGRFEQTLTGSIYLFPKPDGSNAKRTPSAPNAPASGREADVFESGFPVPAEVGGTLPAPDPTITPLEDGSQIQYFDDGSQLITDSEGNAFGIPAVTDETGQDIGGSEFEAPDTLGGSEDQEAERNEPQTMSLEF